MQQHNARLGLVLFFLYLLLYGGFVLLNAFWPETMEATPIAGVNVAILYGAGLIFAAFVLALVYGAMSMADEKIGPVGPSADEITLDEGGQA